MKLLLTFLLPFFLLYNTPGWLNNFEEAKKTAAEKHQLILLNFSGSDWCGPCIRLKKEIFNSDVFKNFADTSIVLINADFPRSSKNKLSKEQVKLNEDLADKYNTTGKFPLTLLLDAKGNMLKEWDGYPDATPEQFVQQIKVFSDAAR